MSDANKVLERSDRKPIAGARKIGPADPNERLEVSVRLRPKTPLKPAIAAVLTDPLAEAPLTHEEYEARHGANPQDVAAVEQFAKEHQLQVADKNLARRTVVLVGKVADMETAFGVTLDHYAAPQVTYRGRTGKLVIPAALKDIVEGVFGLDDRPQAKPRVRQPRAVARTFTPVEVGQLYQFPTGNGSGQRIAIIELDGGYAPADLDRFFSNLGLPTPNVRAVSVDHAHNQPTGDPNGPDGEVMLDIEVAGAVAPGAEIVVYFAPNTDNGFLDAITTAIHDPDPKPRVISISWGGAESNWTNQSLDAFDQAFQAAALLGISVCCASGDDGSTDRVKDHLQHVDFPASSPFALACGGTRLDGNGTTIRSEVVWNNGTGGGATGGGVSEHFPLPGYQAAAGVPASVNPGGFRGRGVPDVAGNADPNTGYQVTVDGEDTVIGGTSAVAPLWAGLLTILQAGLGRSLGAIHPLIYGACPTAFNDVTSGNNGAFSARQGWDACTGLGSPEGTALLSCLQRRLTPAGKLQLAANGQHPQAPHRLLEPVA